MSYSQEWVNLSGQQRSTIEEFQKEIPIKLGEIAKRFGLVVKKATLPPNISGEIKETNGQVVIKVNRHDVKARQRFTLAHEISHFLLHRELLRNGIRDDVLYRSKHSDKIEAEANRLAADILMPLAVSLKLMESHEVDVKGELLYEKVADVMGVSTTALKIRLGKM